MNADRIIVVTNGEIIEQGSHEELIRADGKYAELWSKQIFVKPKEKDVNSENAKGKRTKEPNIVNDLTNEATNTELAKVKSAPGPLNKMGGDSDADAKQGEPASEAALLRTPSSHKKEV